jgi:NNP family nitrate/nitrite transporter-like MFS transporter
MCGGCCTAGTDAAGRAAAIGICSAVAAFGGVLIQQAFRISLEQTRSISPALTGLAVL